MAATTASVKVGVRVRPPLPREKGSGICIQSWDDTSLALRHQTFTFDQVFGADRSQEELYAETASPMLKSFLEGYNVTILAYGQTGSGKTFTMGTSDGLAVASDQGLIPRFLFDLFENIRAPQSASERTSFRAKVSFLEIYGEDIFDLLVPKSAERPSLAVREDENGHIQVLGLHEVEVGSAASALEQLGVGTRNRVTGHTSMNAGSSRSHAVFTISLRQTISCASAAGDGADIHEMTSKLTFVDLAGSERIKRTCAEGQRLKEGIQINSGLFNLGQVINCLADEQRLRSGKAPGHIPYRNSKLTHLLKDALGGNSQTLFLACVSPSECNENETLSTLQYAKQARNIQNKPVQNMDKTQLEIRKLKYSLKAWMAKAIELKFGSLALPDGSEASQEVQLLSPDSKLSKYLQSGSQADGQSQEVTSFLREVSLEIDQSLKSSGHPTPKKVRLSVLSLSPVARTKAAPMGKTLSRSRVPSDAGSATSPNENADCNSAGSSSDSSGGAVAKSLFAGDQADESGSNSPTGENAGLARKPMEIQDSEETERLVNRMIEIVCKEREILSSEVDEEKELEAITYSIQEKEAILLKLSATVKSYSVLQTEYERLLESIDLLEKERRELEEQLVSARRQEEEKKEPGRGSEAAAQRIEKMNERYLKIKEELDRVNKERQKKESAFRLIQRESKQCDVLRSEITKLKESRAQMIKQQRAQSQSLLKLRKEQTVKINALKRSDVKKQQLMNALKGELTKKSRVISIKDKEIERVQSKLRACETHLSQLLRLQSQANKARSAPRSELSQSQNLSQSLRLAQQQLVSSFGCSSEERQFLRSTKEMIDRLVTARVDKQRALSLISLKTQELTLLNTQVIDKARRLDQIVAERRDLLLREDATGAAGRPAEAEIMALGPFDLEAFEEDMVNAANKSRSLSLAGLSRELESQINELSLSIDLCNEIIEEQQGLLARSLSEDQGQLWEDICRESIAKLSSSQAQLLAWESVLEKLELQERIQELDDKLQSSQEEAESAQRSFEELKLQFAAFRLESDRKLEEAEKKRVNDLWTLVSSSNAGCAAREQEDGTCSPREGSLPQEVAFSRALLLERELEVLLTQQEDSAQEMARLQDQLREKPVVDQSFLDGRAAAFRDRTVTLARSLGLDAGQLARLESFVQSRVDGCLDACVLELEAMHAGLLRELPLHRSIQGFLQEVLGESPSSEPAQLARPAEPVVSVQEALRLRARTEACLKQFGQRRQRAVECKHRLLSLVAEMHLEISDLPVALRGLLKIHFIDGVEDAEDVPEPLLFEYGAGELLANFSLRLPFVLAEAQSNFAQVGWKLTEAGLEACEKLTSELNRRRVQIAVKNRALVDKLRSLLTVLSWSRVDLDAAAHSLAQLLPDSAAQDVADISASFRSNLSPERKALARDQAMELLLASESGSNPSGNPALCLALEQFDFCLESAKTARSSASALLRRLTEAVRAQCQCGGGGGGGVSGAVSEPGQTNEAGEPGFSQESLDHWTAQYASAKQGLELTRRQHTAELRETLVGLRCFSEEDIAARMDNPLLGQPDSADLSAFLRGVQEVLGEFEDLVMFVEEDRVRTLVQRVLDEWSEQQQQQRSVSLMDQFLQLLKLKAGCARFGHLLTCVKDVERLDGLLTSLTREMDEFENQSKQDRLKLLSGSSKALIEEERFRKQSKRKFEQTLDRLMTAWTELQQALSLNPSVLMSASSAALVSQRRVKEKVELMHLHTAIPSGRRASDQSGEGRLSGFSTPGSASVPSTPLHNAHGGSHNATPRQPRERACSPPRPRG